VLWHGISPFLDRSIAYTPVSKICTTSDRDAVYKEPLNELKRYRILFSDRIHLNQAPLVLLEANSNYYFFYDKQTQQSIVMRKELIEYVENLN
jgi:hypothetical protein